MIAFLKSLTNEKYSISIKFDGGLWALTIKNTTRRIAITSNSLIQAEMFTSEKESIFLMQTQSPLTFVLFGRYFHNKLYPGNKNELFWFKWVSCKHDMFGKVWNEVK